jgi:circadian clock protein KaiC
MNDTLRSGNGPLDAVLGGGLPAHAISLIMGLPGTGKTIIAQQYAFHNGHPDRPAVYFSTLSEPLEKIVRFGQTLDFFDISAIGRSVFYEDLGETVNRDGLAGVVDQITLLLKQRRPGLVVIDSFKALRAFAEDDAQFRRFLYQLAGRLTAFPAASLWVDAERVGAALRGRLPAEAAFPALVRSGCTHGWRSMPLVSARPSSAIARPPSTLRFPRPG